MFNERRRAPRQNGFKVGSAYFGDSAKAVECLVWNVSDFGAMIEVGANVEVPQHLRLTEASLGIDRPCMVIWRDGRKHGIAYIFG